MVVLYAIRVPDSNVRKMPFLLFFFVPIFRAWAHFLIIFQFVCKHFTSNRNSKRVGAKCIHFQKVNYSPGFRVISVCLCFTAEFPVSMRRCPCNATCKSREKRWENIISALDSIINSFLSQASKMNGKFDFQVTFLRIKWQCMKTRQYQFGMLAECPKNCDLVFLFHFISIDLKLHGKLY